jgi:diacylglycerol kinase family enzyme
MTPPHGPICVILNEGSGDAAAPGAQRDDLVRRLEAQRVPARLKIVAPGLGPARLARQALEEGARTVVAAGGDGTVSGVAEAVVGSGAWLGILPQGTFNFFARGLDIPQEIDAAIAVLAAGYTRSLQLGEVNGRIFLNNCSLGLYPSILQEREDVYRRWGRSRIAAYWSVLVALTAFRRPMRLSLTLDGQHEHLRTPLVFIANSAYQLEQYKLDGAQAVRAGHFALFAVPCKTRRELVEAALRLAQGAARRNEEFLLRTAQEIRIDTGRRRALVARDGEKLEMEMPLVIHHRTEPLRIIVPDAQSATLQRDPAP